MKVYVVSCDDYRFSASIFHGRMLEGITSEVLAVFTSLKEAKTWVRDIAAFMKEVDPEKYRDELDEYMYVYGKAKPLNELKYKIETLELNQNTKKNRRWSRQLRAMGLNPAVFSKPIEPLAGFGNRV